MKDKKFMIGDFPIQQDEMGKALSHFVYKEKGAIMQESDFFIFSKNKRSKKYLAFFNRDENPEEIKNEIFGLTKWEDFLLIDSGSLSFSLDEDKNNGMPQFILSFGKDRDEKQIAFENLKVFQGLTKKITKIKKLLVPCDFVINVSLYCLDKQTPILVEK